MRTTKLFIVATLVGTLAASSVLAASGDACLQNNRIWSWRMVNGRTLIVTDVNYRPFTVHLTGGCVGLTNAIRALSFGTWMDLSCLTRGDRVSFREPTLGRMSCFVTEVQPGVPAPAQAN